MLAGGSSRRLGRDKLAAELGGRSVLALLLDGVHGVAPSAELVVVGPAERSAPGVVVVREDPPGGGPVAGLAAGLAASSGAVPGGALADEDVVGVLAGDQPFAATALPQLTAVLASSVDAVLGTDPDGRDQPLLAVYRAGSLRRAIAEVSTGAGPAGARVRDVVGRLRVARVAVSATVALDVDTEADLARARAVVRARYRAGATARPAEKFHRP